MGWDVTTKEGSSIMWTESLVDIVHAQNELFSLLKVSEGLDLWKNQWVQLQYLVLVGPEVQCDR